MDSLGAGTKVPPYWKLNEVIKLYSLFIRLVAKGADFCSTTEVEGGIPIFPL